MANIGRPTEYTEELLAKARKYIVVYETEGDEIPSVVGLAKYLNRSRSCINLWATQEDKKDFLDILENINEEQQKVLINKGLNGTFNANITKLVLGKHGYHEKTDTKHSGVVGAVDLTNKTDEELEDIINRTK